MKANQLRIAELFSGIGAQNKALANISKELNFNYKIELTCEWDMHAILAYDLIHNKPSNHFDISSDEEIFDTLFKMGVSWNGKELLKFKTLKRVNPLILQRVHQSILKNNNCVNIKQMNYQNIPEDLDILTYSFPCQDLSNMGHLHGYADGIDKSKSSRSGLLWEIDRVLKDIKRKRKSLPKVLLMENVTSLLSPRHSSDFNDWKRSLVKLGYNNCHWILKASEFGVPQNRERLIMISILKDNYRKDLFRSIEYSINSKKVQQPKNVEFFLRTDYKNKKYYIDAIESQPNRTLSRLKIWNENPKIIDDNGNYISIIPTITTKQDRHPNSGNLYFEGDPTKANYRFLTPRECFLLMGFNEFDYEKLDREKLISFNGSNFLSRDIRYKLAGNSVVVPILEAVFYGILSNVDLG